MRFQFLIYFSLLSLFGGCGYQEQDAGAEASDSELQWQTRRQKQFIQQGNIPASQNNKTKLPSSETQSSLNLKYPVVFHHGFMGGTGMGMNEKVVSLLKAKGVRVFRTEVSPANSIAFRARQLAKQIDKILNESKSRKVNIIAHSMGGLDSRYLISSLGYNEQVASLTTIATPHRGTPLADLALKGRGKNKLLNVFVTLASKTINGESTLKNNDLNAALRDLSPSNMQNNFNPKNPDHPGVYYQSYAGVSGRESKDRLMFMLLLPYNLIKRSHGANDGVVPLSSARWSNFKGQLHADHIDLSGFRNLSQTVTNYESFIYGVVQSLSENGF